MSVSVTLEKNIPQEVSWINAPINVPLRVSSVSEVQSYTKPDDIVVIVMNQCCEISVLLDPRSLRRPGVVGLLHRPGYTLKLVALPVRTEYTFDNETETN